MMDKKIRYHHGVLIKTLVVQNVVFFPSDIISGCIRLGDQIDSYHFTIRHQRLQLIAQCPITGTQLDNPSDSLELTYLLHNPRWATHKLVD